jgi:hypothetical protein
MNGFSGQWLVVSGWWLGKCEGECICDENCVRRSRPFGMVRQAHQPSSGTLGRDDNVKSTV